MIVLVFIHVFFQCKNKCFCICNWCLVYLFGLLVFLLNCDRFGKILHHDGLLYKSGLVGFFFFLLFHPRSVLLEVHWLPIFHIFFWLFFFFRLRIITTLVVDRHFLDRFKLALNVDRMLRRQRCGILGAGLAASHCYYIFLFFCNSQNLIKSVMPCVVEQQIHILMV